MHLGTQARTPASVLSWMVTDMIGTVYFDGLSVFPRPVKHRYISASTTSSDNPDGMHTCMHKRPHICTCARTCAGSLYRPYTSLKSAMDYLRDGDQVLPRYCTHARTHACTCAGLLDAWSLLGRLRTASLRQSWHASEYTHMHACTH